MFVYHVSFRNLGVHAVLQPKVPEHKLPNEDSSSKRICVCTTIPGCLEALHVNMLFDGDNENIIFNPILKQITVFLYKANIDPRKLYKPSSVEVRDAWKTGEFWILKEQGFMLVDTLEIRKHMDLPYSCYSRYAVHSTREDEVLDRVAASAIYGDPTSFSYIAYDPSRAEEAIKYSGLTFNSNNGGEV